MLPPPVFPPGRVTGLGERGKQRWLERGDARQEEPEEELKEGRPQEPAQVGRADYAPLVGRPGSSCRQRFQGKQRPGREQRRGDARAAGERATFGSQGRGAGDPLGFQTPDVAWLGGGSSNETGLLSEAY